MQSKHVSYRFDWLMDDKPGSISVTTDDHERIEYPLDPMLGAGFLETRKLPMGITLFRGICKFNPLATGMLLPILEFDTTYPEPTFSVQSERMGHICHYERHPQCNLIYSPGLELFRYADQAAAKVVIDGSHNSEMTSLSLTSYTLIALLGENQAQLLLDGLGLSKVPSVVVHSVPNNISTTLYSTFAINFKGSAAELFIQAKVLEYLGLLFKHISSIHKVKPVDTKNPSMAEDIREYLIALEGKLPTMTELSKEFGRSARLLNQEFVEEFGQSIYTYITEHRLNAAHSALIHSPIPMKNLAHNLGYSHVNHFITAFRRKFGYSPGSLRKTK